jgi:hypothetical protein
MSWWVILRGLFRDLRKSGWLSVFSAGLTPRASEFFMIYEYAKTWSQNLACRYVIFECQQLIVVGRGEDEAAAVGRGSAMGADRAVDPATRSGSWPWWTTTNR